MANWAQINDELLVEIARRMASQEDFIAFGGVCISWRSAASKVNFGLIPWLLLPPKLNCNNSHGFLSVSRGLVDNAFGGFSRQIMSPDIKYFSCKDWIVTLDQDGSMSLLHPFTRKQIELPHVKTFSNGFFRFLPDMYKSLIHKCVLSTSPSSSSDYTVMVIYKQDLRYLAYCRAGDKTWTTVFSGQTMFHDVVYYKEKFYAINSFNSIHVCDVRSDINPTMTQVVGNIPGELSKQKPERLYMVESEGALLVVMGRKYYSDNRSWVFSVDLSTNTWTEIKDLGKRSLFLSQNFSVSVEISFDDNYCKSNCIYFVQDCTESGFCGRKVEEGKELRVYNMQDGSTEEVYNMQGEHHIPLMWLEDSFY